MPRKLFIKTFGCQMNEYDSAKMAEVLRVSCGYELTDRAEDADVILLNTCSVREKAEEKVFSQLGWWRELKQQRPELVIGVGGCVASQEGAGIVKRAPFVDLVFGPQTLHRPPEVLNQARRRYLPGELSRGYPSVRVQAPRLCWRRNSIPFCGENGVDSGTVGRNSA